jgi:hypothetical protein
MKKEIIVIRHFNMGTPAVSPITIKAQNLSFMNSVTNSVLSDLCQFYDIYNDFSGTRYRVIISDTRFINAKWGILTDVPFRQYSRIRLFGIDSNKNFICGRYLNRLLGKEMKEGDIVYFSFEKIN